jgi:type VI secretion system protein ImpG
MRDELLGFYERELLFLRRMGAEFARKYPKIASRLLLDEEKIEDPHVERMIEAFAFLAARIQLKLDDELPEITESFLNVLYPHYLAPIPSMAIAQFGFGSPSEKLTSIQKVPRGTRLASRPVDGTPCRFRTCYDVDLVPVEILSATLESNAPTNAQGLWSEAEIKIKMRCFGDANLHEIKNADTQESIKSLRFFLNGEPQLVYPLYELIFNQTASLEIRQIEPPASNISLIGMSKTMFSMKPAKPVVLSPDAIKAVGFEENEGILPYTARSFLGYRLLTEYFAFPYKFLFFEVTGLDQAAANRFGSHFEIAIRLRDVQPPRFAVTRETFRLGCTPIVNLFNQTADPIYVSQQKYEYHVLPDVHRQTVTEIYSIDAVTTSDPRTNTVREFQPFYSLRHAYGEQYEKAFWYANRRQSQRENDTGTEVFISLVDKNFNARAPAAEVLTVKTTCTNRDLPARLPFGGRDNDFETEGTAILSRVRCLTKPTETIRPPQRRAAQWRLISHLNLNYLSLVENAAGEPEALREILQLYNFDDSAATRKQILGIVGISTRRVVRQIGQRIGAGFVRGLETTLEFDEEQFVGSSAFLFACVLDRFLALAASLNSFNQLVVKTRQREGVLRRFEPRAGDRILL